MKATGMEDNSEAKSLAQIERHSYSEVGWISRQNLLALRSRENFFLDIPFYRTVRGLNHNHNHDLKNLFKGAAISASTRPGPLYDFYVALVEKGIRPTMARLTLARKIAAITLTIWKKGVEFDAKQLNRQAA